MPIKELACTDFNPLENQKKPSFDFGILMPLYSKILMVSSRLVLLFAIILKSSSLMRRASVGKIGLFLIHFIMVPTFICVNDEEALMSQRSSLVNPRE